MNTKAPLLATMLFLAGIQNALADDIFLFLEGIDGESADSTHQNQITVNSWNWQLSSLVAGKPVIRPLVITKEIDKSTPLLFSHILTQRVIPTATLSARVNSQTFDYVVIDLTNVTLGSDASGSDTTSRATETLSINFETICLQYTPVNPNTQSGPGASIRQCWNTVTNTAF